MTAADYKDLLTAFVANASALRSAGVLKLKLGEMEIELSPAAEQASKATAEDIFPGDPMDDPATFGGRMPTYERE